MGPGRRTVAEGTTTFFRPVVESELWGSMQEMRVIWM